jgi:hypothetical protein
MTDSKESLFVRVGAIKPLIKQVANDLGVSSADYIRFTLKQDLKKRGLLKETVLQGVN